MKITKIKKLHNLNVKLKSYKLIKITYTKIIKIKIINKLLI